MPEMDGIELLEIVTEQYPHIVKMVLSGSTNSIELTKAIHHGSVFKFIPKPWNLQEGEKLIEIVRCAIDYYNLKNEHAAKVQN